MFFLYCLFGINIIAISALNNNNYNNNNNNVNLKLLSNNSKPLVYNLQLIIDLERLVFSGSVSIDLMILENTRNILLNSKDLNITYDKIRLTDDKRSVKNLISSNDTHFEVIELIYNELNIGKYSLYIEFSGIITDNLKGLYISRYYNDNKIRNIATTFFAPNYARRVFPCYDEPRFKATFKLSIRHSNKFTAISNMPMLTIISMPEIGVDITVFEETLPMSTYTLAFIVSDFKQISNETFAVFSQDNIIDDVELALHFGQNSLRKIEDYVGSTFQLPKMDFVAIDDFLMGAMENWGLITFKSSKIIYDDSKTNIKSYQDVLNIITHELMHQFFGNDVTCKWWSYTWLNEGFATFFADFITSTIMPKWRLMDQFIVNTMQHCLYLDSDPDARSMNSKVTNTNELSKIYDYVSYKKAASIINMIQHFVGLEDFQQSIRSYFHDRRRNYSTPEDLYSNFENVLLTSENTNLSFFTEAFRSWADNPGYPLVTISRNYSSGEINLSQERFLSTGWEEDKVVSNFYIPLNFASRQNPDFLDTKPTDWLISSEENKTISSNITANDWIIFNKQQTGYYRVNYDSENWKLIIDQLKGKHYKAIHSTNRAQLIDDSFNLATYNYFSFNVTLELLSYLEKELDYIPFVSAFKSLQFLNFILRGNEKFYLIENYSRYLIKNVYKTNSMMSGRKRTDHIENLLEMDTVTFACKVGLPDCVTKAQKMLKDQNKKLPVNLREAIYCGGARSNDPTYLTGMLNRLEIIISTWEDRSKNLDHLYEMFNGLGCSQDNQFNFFVKLLSLEEGKYKLLPEDKRKLFETILTGSYSGTKQSLLYLNQSFSVIREKYDSMSSLFILIGEQIISEELNLLFNVTIEMNRHQISDDEMLSVNKVKDIIENNLNWIDMHSNEIIIWLEEHNKNHPNSGNSIRYNYYNIIFIFIIFLVNCIKCNEFL